MNGVESSTGARALSNAVGGLLDAPARVASSLAHVLTRRGLQGCEIPPPCWEPQPAGSCCLTLTPRSTATIRVHVSNCGWNRQIVGITALGKLAGILTFEPTTLILGPMERATFLVTVHVPANVKPGLRLSGPLIIRGCLDHFARIDVIVSDCAGTNCCDISVDDCPDHVHHWYDHFYCPRPCRTFKQREANG
jgi:hypothetical protein